MANLYRDTAILQAFLTIQKSLPGEHVYLVGEAGVWEIFLTSASSYLDGMEIALANENSQQHGYLGPGVWLKKLSSLGVKPKKVHLLDGVIDHSFEVGDGRRINTLTEMFGLVRWQRANEILEVWVIMPHFHHLRVAVSYATACTKLGFKPQVTFIPVPVGEWDHDINHSQGIQPGSMAEITTAEIDKVAGPNRYQNLLTPAETLSWFESL